MENMEKIKVNWFTKLLLKLRPQLAMKQFAKKMGIDDPLFDKAHDLFSQVKHIDIIPFKSGERGFTMILDRKTALYFYQDGKHFVYDGYEMGEYEKGDVTLFDRFR